MRGEWVVVVCVLMVVFFLVLLVGALSDDDCAVLRVFFLFVSLFVRVCLAQRVSTMCTEDTSVMVTFHFVF